MAHVIVVENPKRWPLHVPGAPVVSAKSYLTDAHYSDIRNLKVYNLCRSYRYQSVGYYVSLLAMARGHRPLPSITTIQDMKTLTITRIVAEDLEAMIRKSLRSIKSATFTLSIYFGRNTAKTYDELSQRLFRLFEAPLLRAEFRHEDDQWALHSIRPIAASDIPESHQPFAVEAATEYFGRSRSPARRRQPTLYDLAILHDPAEQHQPSNRGALRKFYAAARRLRMGVEFIDRDDYGRIAEFNALFIRETTAVNHHTYRFARRAIAEGLVVIDDPESIAKCSNKVYLAELMNRYDVPIPKTLIIHRDNRELIRVAMRLPCILKQPDSSFSQGVMKAESETEVEEIVDRLLEKSDLIIAQEFLKTDMDWRIGVLDRKPLFACKYFMVKEHWQIAQTQGAETRFGSVEAVPLEDVPPAVIDTALRAARPIGDGLYGVDLKVVGNRVFVMEVNDNPNIDAGQEDKYLGNELYDRVMGSILARLKAKTNGEGRKSS